MTAARGFTQPFWIETYVSRRILPGSKRPQKHRWRAKARNGRKIANGGEAYTNYGDMIDIIHLMFGPDVEIRRVAR